MLSANMKLFLLLGGYAQNHCEPDCVLLGPSPFYWEV